MAYPQASFGDFVFRTEERPITGTDSRWRRQPRRDRNANLGTAADSVVTLALGSAERSYEAYFEPDRFAALEALIGVTDEFTDWDRPTPGTGNAYLDNVEAIREVASIYTVSETDRTRRKIRAKVSLLSQ